MIKSQKTLGLYRMSAVFIYPHNLAYKCGLAYKVHTLCGPLTPQGGYFLK